MTRKSKRELERALDNLDGVETRDTIDVVYWNEKTQEHVDREGNPVEPDPDPDAAHVVVIKDTLVMEREQAIEEDREIFGPAETPSGRDIVKVAKEYDTQRKGGGT